MVTVLDGPDSRVAKRVGIERRAVAEVARRRMCEGCGQRRLCAPVVLLQPSARWFCLAECWLFRFGVKQGEINAIDELAELVAAFRRVLQTDRARELAELEAQVADGGRLLAG